jgi:preprotein translocase subunit SecF
MRPLIVIRHVPKIDFMRWHLFGFAFSLALTALTVALFFTVGLNYGIDFVGGTLIEARTTSGPADLGAMRAKLDGLHLGDASLQQFGSPNDVLIRLPQQPGGDAAQMKAVQLAREALGAGIEYRRTEVVGPSVGGELIRAGVLATVLALGAILIYIWFRFEWQFGVGALLTLAHDVAMTLGFFAFTRLQVDLNVVAAFLTIVGYSLNDTVVIYDRIREDLRKYRKMAILPLINLSLNETLARTVVTSFTVLIALGVLMLIGPQVIFGLAIAIFLGVVIGTYSSIYISAPVLVWLGIKPDSFLRTEDKDAPEAQPA